MTPPKETISEVEEILTEEWEKPSVQELDINAVTLAGSLSNTDGGGYS